MGISVRSLLILVISSIFYFLFSANSALAQTAIPSLIPTVSPIQTKTSAPPTTNVDASVPDNLHNWTQTVMIEVMSSLSCQLTGIDPTTATKQCLGVDIKTGKIGFLPSGNSEKGEVGGAIGTMGNMITMLYTPPIHTSDYFRNLASNFGIIKTSYAQTSETNGTGFEGLRPLLNLWTAFRNIVYLFFVIVFVVIGLAIMLRVKIDPRTVMTIQNQIPKIIIGILLVTFSYAIAGFLVDMMYVSIHVIGNMILSADPTLDKKLPTQLSRETNPFQAVGHVGANGDNAVAGLWNLVFSPSKSIGEIIGSFLPIPSGFLIRGFFSWLAGTIGFLVIAIALLIALFRLWFTLLMAYVQILLSVVLGPFWIIAGMFPGSPISLSGWLRNLGANLLAFPATIAMFLLGKVFYDQFGKGEFLFPFVPPLIGDRASIDTIGPLIGLGIILMTPNVVNMLKAALKVPKVDTGGIAGALGTGVGLPISVGKGIGGIMHARKEVRMTDVDKAGNVKYGNITAGKAFLERLIK